MGVVGFEPTHRRTDLQSAATLQLRRTPITWWAVLVTIQASIKQQFYRLPRLLNGLPTHYMAEDGVIETQATYVALFA